MKPYAQPALYWLSASIGLVLALVSNGAGDAAALCLLTLPLVGIVGALVRGRMSKR